MPPGSYRVEVFGTRLASGTVPAHVLEDGRVCVRNVPIFSEVRPTDAAVAQGARDVRTKAWLERARDLHMARLKMGKRPLMTHRHQFDNPLRVGEYELNGQLIEAEVNPDEPPRWTLMGDKYYDDVQAFEASAKYLYRSPEISPDHPEELQALALLKDKEPMNPYPGLYEKLVRETTPELAEAFAGEAFAAQLAESPQVWQGSPEVFEAKSARHPLVIATTLLAKKQIDKGQFDRVVQAIKGGEAFAALPQDKKEGGVADQDDKDKPKSAEERMEAMAAKFFEAVSKKFEAMVSKYEGKGGKDEKPEGDEKPEASEAAPDDEKKKAEAAQSRGPNDNLPPAVAELAAGEFFSAAQFAEALKLATAPPKNGTAHKNGATAKVETAAAPPAAPALPEAFSQRLAVQEQTILGLRGSVEKMQRERDAVGLVAEAKKSLLDSGAASVSELFEAEVYKAAVKGGKAKVDEFVAQVKIGMGLGQTRGPEVFAALPGQANVPGLVTPEQESLKKALETFGNRPETKRRVEAFYADYMSHPEHIRRSLGQTTFYDLCRGESSINAGARQGEVIRG